MLVGNAENPRKGRDYMTALFSLPCVSKQIRGELSDILPELPPISKICFVFKSFTKEDMQSFVGGMGRENVKHIRKWTIDGTAKCFHEVYQNGHLLKSRNGGRGTCTFFTDGVDECNLRCKSREERLKRGTCRRKVQVNLDKHETEDREDLPDIALWKTRWRVDNVRAEDRLERVFSKLGHERETTKKALLMYRNVVYHAPSHRSWESPCFWSDPLEALLNEEGNIEVNQQTFVNMVEAVIG